jgi:hypothetical protein
MRYKFLAVGLGLLAGILAIVISEGISGMLYPLPAEINPADMEAINGFMRNDASIEMFLIVLLGYALGAFAGGFTASWFERLQPIRLRAALITGGILMVFGMMNLFMIYHPVWFWVSSLLVYLPAAWLGGKLAMQVKK